jgi:hypothetical protein
MDVLRELLSEQDVLEMPDVSIEAFSRLLDDKLAARIHAYYSDPAAEARAKERVQDKLIPSVERMMFGLLVKERGLVAFVSDMTLDSLRHMNIDRAKAIADLEWLLANKSKLKAYIEPRRKDDYLCFLKGLGATAASQVKANSALFYDRLEKPRSTGMGVLIYKADKWEMALKGLKYLEYLSARNLQSSYLGKEF